MERRRTLRQEGQETRRRRLLARQRAFRSDQLRKSRGLQELLTQDEEEPQSCSPGVKLEMEMDQETTGKKSSDERKRRKLTKTERYYSEQFQTPEWMIEVPKDLGQGNWFVMAKPEGKKCLVIAKRGSTLVRLRNGRIWKRFSSSLPYGNGGGGRNEYTILECIYHAPNKTFYVSDMICWKGFFLNESMVDFRFFWIANKLSETPELSKVIDNVNDFRFEPIPVFPCNLDGLRRCYEGQTSYVKNGLLFYCIQSCYTPGLTPLVLSWKDAKTSKYPIDSPDGVNPYPEQRCVLLADKDQPHMMRALSCSLQDENTMDDNEQQTNEEDDQAVQGETTVVAMLNPSIAKVQNIHGNDLVQVVINGQVRLNDGRLEIENVAFDGKSSRHMPDSIDKIAYQFSMRHAPIKIEAIIQTLGSA